MKRVMISAFAALLSACSGTIPVQYIPQTIVKAEGQTDIGQFTYEPFLQGHVRSNQIQNTAIGSILIATDVATLVQRGTAAELEKAGVRITADSPIRLTGVVKTFRASDIGFSARWTYTVQYTISRKSDQAILLQKDYSAPKVTTGKFGSPSDYAPSLNEMILAGVEAFLRDPEALRLLKDQPAN